MTDAVGLGPPPRAASRSLVAAGLLLVVGPAALAQDERPTPASPSARSTRTDPDEGRGHVRLQRRRAPTSRTLTIREDGQARTTDAARAAGPRRRQALARVRASTRPRRWPTTAALDRGQGGLTDAGRRASADDEQVGVVTFDTRRRRRRAGSPPTTPSRRSRSTASSPRRDGETRAVGRRQQGGLARRGRARPCSRTSCSSPTARRHRRRPRARQIRVRPVRARAPAVFAVAYGDLEDAATPSSLGQLVERAGGAVGHRAPTRPASTGRLRRRCSRRSPTSTS